MTYFAIMKHLVTIALKYNWDDIKEYIADVGWEPEWMCDFMEDPEAEILSIYDKRRINDMLIRAFEEAHHRRLYWSYRKDLLDY